MRNMSFSLTTKQFIDGSKTVTRRLGWKFLKPGDRVMACEKCQGLKKGEKVKRLGEIEIINVTRERLDCIAKPECVHYDKGCYYETDCLKEQIAQLQAKITELEEQNRWIPVEERLPETKGDYLILREGKVSICYYTGTRFGWGELSQITRWMKIPTLPKESEGE